VRLLLPRCAPLAGLLLAAHCSAGALGPAAGARMHLNGWPLATREGEALFAPALRTPGDSSALALALRKTEARLQSGGWLDARVHAAWEPAGAWLAVDAEPGVRYRWGNLSCDVPRSDSLILARLLHWRRGAPADPAELEGAIGEALRAAEGQGYAWAQLAVWAWEPDSGRVDVRLSGALGPLVHVSGVRITGLQVTRRDVAERALGRWLGVPYNPQAARASAARLAQLGVFSRAEFTGLEGGPQWESGVLAFQVTEPRYNRFEGALGLQGQAGVVGRATLDLGNLLGTARSAALGWQSRGRGRSDFNVRYTEPYVGGLPFRLELALVQQLQDSTYTRTRWGVRVGHALGTGDRIELGLEEEQVVQTRGEARTANLQNTVFAFERDGRDDRVAPRHGTRLRVSGTGVSKRETLRGALAGTPATRRARAGVVDARIEWQQATGAGSGVALELWGAGRFTSERVLAPFERTPVGGASTLRGHDEEAFRADRVALSRLEYCWFPGGAGERVSIFWDHARMLTREPVLDALGAVRGDRAVMRAASGVGLGLRLRAAGGLVDLDYGLEPGRGFLDGRIHLRLVSTF
jgi:outer membrane protein assembly factor BamA